jgi:hypothetical protein
MSTSGPLSLVFQSQEADISAHCHLAQAVCMEIKLIIDPVREVLLATQVKLVHKARNCDD